MSDWDAAEGISRTGTVVVTGHLGFVGRHVTRQFRDAGWRVYGVDLGDRFPDEHANMVVSLAATADPVKAMALPVAAYTNGVEIMARTLAYAKKHHARVLHVSTNEAINPRGPYGGAKACQEVVCEATPDVETTIVVTQSLFGEYQQPDKLVPTAVKAILEDRPVMVQRNGDGYAKRPFMHVRNLAVALTDLAARDTRGKHRVNVGSTIEYRLDDVVDRIASALGRKAVVMPVEAGDRPGHEHTVDLVGCDLYGRHLPYETIPALGDVARWYAKNPGWLP